MKIKMMKVLSLLVVTLLATGCAGTLKEAPMYVDVGGGELRQAYVGQATVGGADRSTSVAQFGYDSGERDENGDPILIQIAAEMNTGNTLVGDMLRSSVAGIGAAYIQGEAIRSSARTKAGAFACPEGSQVCHSTILQGAQSNAVSGSQSSSTANTAISGPCPGGTCVRAPMD